METDSLVETDSAVKLAAKVVVSSGHKNSVAATQAASDF